MISCILLYIEVILEVWYLYEVGSTSKEFKKFILLNFFYPKKVSKICYIIEDFLELFYSWKTF